MPYSTKQFPTVPPLYKVLNLSLVRKSTSLLSLQIQCVCCVKMLYKSCVRASKVVMANFVTVLLLIQVSAYGFSYGADGLNMNYYLMRCPFVEPVVKNIVNRALMEDPTLAAGLIRMHFHDCFIQVPSLSLSHYSGISSLTHGCNTIQSSSWHIIYCIYQFFSFSLFFFSSNT